MSHCKNCEQKLGYRKILKSLWLGYRDVKCQRCGTLHEHIFLNRITMSLSIGAALILSFGFKEEISTLLPVKFGNILFYLLILAAFALPVPFVSRFRLKKVSTNSFKNPSEEY